MNTPEEQYEGEFKDGDVVTFDMSHEDTDECVDVAILWGAWEGGRWDPSPILGEFVVADVGCSVVCLRIKPINPSLVLAPDLRKWLGTLTRDGVQIWPLEPYKFEVGDKVILGRDCWGPRELPWNIDQRRHRNDGTPEYHIDEPAHLSCWRPERSLTPYKDPRPEPKFQEKEWVLKRGAPGQVHDARFDESFGLWRYQWRARGEALAQSFSPPACTFRYAEAEFTPYTPPDLCEMWRVADNNISAKDFLTWLDEDYIILSKGGAG